MSSKKNQKWSSSSISLTKIYSRITRTLSFSSSKRQQSSSKKNNKTVPLSQSAPKNSTFIPKSVPVIRRNPPPPISNNRYNNDIRPTNYYRQGYHINLSDESINDDEDDYSQYSLRPNLSLFNISLENLNSQQVPEQSIWLDEIFHSTKLEH